jgi:hypothetical protein
MEVPDGLGNKEIVILYLSVEVVGRDIEKCLTSVEVEMDAVALGDSGLPGGMVSVGVEWMRGVAPCVLESLDLTEILFLTRSDHQVFVLYHTAISQDYLTLLRIEPFDTDIVRSCVVLAECLPCRCSKIELGDAVYKSFYEPVS